MDSELSLSTQKWKTVIRILTDGNNADVSFIFITDPSPMPWISLNIS